jgi:predicted metal-dependent phosphoesterase TrpH
MVLGATHTSNFQDNIKIDFHCHSSYSFDSIMNVRKIVKVAKKRGLSGIAITDHNAFNGAIAAAKVKEPNFFVICGCEIATEKGEILGLFLTDAVKYKDPLEVIDEIRDQGGISLIPHPFKRSSTIDKDLLEKVDGVEVFNARASMSQNKMAENLYPEFRTVTAGSDAHFYFEIGRGVTSMETVDGVEEIRKNLLKGKINLNVAISSPYVETMSQIVRFSKTRDSKVLLRNVILNTGIFTYKLIRGC